MLCRVGRSEATMQSASALAVAVHLADRPVENCTALGLQRHGRPAFGADKLTSRGPPRSRMFGSRREDTAPPMRPWETQSHLAATALRHVGQPAPPPKSSRCCSAPSSCSSAPPRTHTGAEPHRSKNGTLVLSHQPPAQMRERNDSSGYPRASWHREHLSVLSPIRPDSRSHVRRARMQRGCKGANWGPHDRRDHEQPAGNWTQCPIT